MRPRPGDGPPTVHLQTAAPSSASADEGLEYRSGNSATASAAAQREETVAGDGAGTLIAQRDAPVGGQAVLEGVMMRGLANWAVAVRKPAAEPEEGQGASAQPGDIEVRTFPLSSALRRHRSLRLPIVRGVVALAGSLRIGFRALEISANAQLSQLEQEQEQEQEISRGAWAGTVVVALVLAIGLFFLIPVGLTSLIKHQLGSSLLFWLIEGIVRTSIFLGYMVLLSRVRDLRRVFEYHGAEHKTISCFEAGLALTPENCQRFSRLHPRCGTSFLLVVMIVAIFVFAPIGLPAWYWLLTTRVLGVPVIAGVSFELIKFAGRNRNRRWVRALMWPGMKLQLLTTRQPDREQLEVAIAALQAVLAREPLDQVSPEELVGVELVA
ncbi:MAG: DUF1385 domain-containing protein [Actinobacteria bacterium]|nr:MAG: DUF1385 domain-containing protein [Actinomycetota bacterium]